MARRSWKRRLPTAEEITTCPGCGLRVIRFGFGAAGHITVDPTAGQRRWARSLMSARDAAVGPRWGEAFGSPHTCPGRPPSPWDGTVEIRLDGGEEGCRGA